MLGGGRRVGKSTAAIMRGINASLHGKTTSWFCANQELGDENWQVVCDLIEPWASRLNRQQVGVAWFDNSELGKGVFRRKSGFNKFAGRAGTSDLLIFDEMQLITKGLYARALPSILTTRGAVVGTLTPPESPAEYYQSLWVKEIIDSAGADGVPKDARYKNWYVTRKETEPADIAFVFMMTDIGRKTVDDTVLDYYENAVSYSVKGGYKQKGHHEAWDRYINQAVDALDTDKDALTPEEFDREYRFVWMLDSSKLVYGGSVQDGVTRNRKYAYDPTSPVYWFVDRGEGMGYHVVLFVNRIKVGDRTIKDRSGFGDDIVYPIYAYRIFDEIAVKDVISEGQMIHRALEMSKKERYRIPELVIYDVRAPGYRMEILNAGLRPSARNVGIEDGIRKVKRLCVKELLQIHPRCERTWQNMLNYARDMKGFPIDDKDNDAADALRYGVWIVDALSGIPNDTAYENSEMVDEINSEDVEDTESTEGALFLTF